MFPVNQRESLREQLQNVRLAAGFIELALRFEVVDDRHRINGDRLLVHLAHGLKQRAIDGPKEVQGLKAHNSILDNLGRLEHGSEHILLGLFVARHDVLRVGGTGAIRRHIVVFSGHATLPCLFCGFNPQTRADIHNTTGLGRVRARLRGNTRSDLFRA